MTTELSSTQNSRIKELAKLSKRRTRDRQRLTLVEGTRECARALAQGITPVEAYVCPPLVDGDAATTVIAPLDGLVRAGRTRRFDLTPALYAKVAYRGDSGGVLLVIPYVETSLDALPPAANPFYAVVEGVEKPGNLGAILRTADAAGVDGVIICHTPDRPATDLHNPNVVRASLGALFSVPVAEAATDDVLLWLKTRGIALIAATPEATVRYTDVPMTGPVAVALGSEAAGLSDSLLAAAGQRVVIPMVGIIDSLNLATSTALLLYEVVRQRDRAERNQT